VARSLRIGPADHWQTIFTFEGSRSTMKRIFVLALGLYVVGALATPVQSSAQMSLNVGGGIVAATFSGSDADDLGDGASKGSRIGLNVGAWLGIPVAERFSIVAGGVYAQKGPEYSDAGNTLTFKGNYIEIPLFASVVLTGPDSSVGFNIFAGPTFAFEAGCDVKGDDGDAAATVSCDDLGFDERQKFDIGLAGGAGVSFPINERLSVMVSGGYDLGLRKLDTSADPSDLKNSAFFGTVSLGFPIG